MKILIRSQHASIMYHAKNKLLNEVYKSSFDSRDTLSTIAMVRKQMVTIVDRNQYNIQYNFHNTLEIIFNRLSGSIVPMIYVCTIKLHCSG